MVDAFSFAASALQTAQTRQAVSANNVANLLTPAFRAQRVDAATLPGGGVQVAATRTDPRQGAPVLTDRGLDIAVNGDGYFQVETAQGTRYTRAGSFGTDARGEIVDAEGNLLLPGMTAPGQTASIAISGNGTVTAILANGSTQTLGTIELARFPNPGGLLAEGGNRLAPGPASGAAATGTPGSAGFGTLVPSALESSNVDLVTEIVGEIVNKSFFLANLATIRAEDEILGELLDSVG